MGSNWLTMIAMTFAAATKCASTGTVGYQPMSDRSDMCRISQTYVFHLFKQIYVRIQYMSWRPKGPISFTLAVMDCYRETSVVVLIKASPSARRRAQATATWVH
jgi:hypothetical protein